MLRRACDALEKMCYLIRVNTRRVEERMLILDDASLDQLFRTARTFSAWKKGMVSDVMLRALYDLLSSGPTAANCCPARFVFVRSETEKARLKPFLAEGNVEKTMTAPVTAIVANHLEFYESLPKLFPHTDARSWFVGNDDLIRQTAFRNGSLQGAYMILAARSLGLDCGPMSGFDAQGVKDAFFPGEPVEVNFLCNIGIGDPESLHPRSPRFAFDEVCRIL